MLGTNSWFACYVHGEKHGGPNEGGSNDIWYYTIGDSPEVWGFMPSLYVHGNHDPFNGIAMCGGGGGPGGECTTNGPTVTTAQGTPYITKMCGNTADAPLYSTPSRGQRVSTMHSTTSWFTCWVRGAPHEGGNDVWYYTMGDNPNVWGYMPAVYLQENNDPIPGMAQCTGGDGPNPQCMDIGPTVNYQGTSYVTRTCGNDASAPIYAAPNRGQQVSTMLSTNSWFACWVHGAVHEGRNDIWYFTQGDSPNVWGYMPAVYLHEDNDPIPGMVECGVTPPGAHVLNVPFVAQKPELPTGCEVTSLAMMLQFQGVGVDKMTLAAQVDKVPFQYPNGLHGNPNKGFVGNMYGNGPGYGVYHGPVKRLAEQYLPYRTIDLTGDTFDSLLSSVVQGQPVWVITNARWSLLPSSELITWHTPTGDVQITWHEHSVVITGYDDTGIYINDPLDALYGKNKRLDRASFRAAWEQMGRQAITFTPAVSGPCSVDQRAIPTNFENARRYAQAIRDRLCGETWNWLSTNLTQGRYAPPGSARIVFVDKMPDGNPAEVSGTEMKIDYNHVEGDGAQDWGMFTHELAHVFQAYTNGQWATESIADWTRYERRQPPPGHDGVAPFCKSGESYQNGYECGATFLRYLNGRFRDLVPRLNAYLHASTDAADAGVLTLTGTDVATLWSQCQGADCRAR